MIHFIKDGSYWHVGINIMVSRKNLVFAWCGYDFQHFEATANGIALLSGKFVRIKRKWNVVHSYLAQTGQLLVSEVTEIDAMMINHMEGRPETRTLH